MRLKDLVENGGFVSDEPVRKSVKWKNPKTKQEVEFDVLIRRSSYADVEMRLLAPDDKSKSAMTISQSVILGDTGEPISYEQAARIEPGLAKVLLVAIQEVNRADAEEAAKN